MKIIEKRCPNCGGSLDFKVGERDVRCESCRRKFTIEYDANLAELSEKAKEALKAADINLRPMRAALLVIFLAFFIIVATTISITIVTIINSRNELDERAKQSQQEFDETTQQILESFR